MTMMNAFPSNHHDNNNNSNKVVRRKGGSSNSNVYLLRKREVKGVMVMVASGGQEREVVSQTFDRVVGVYPGTQLWLTYALRQVIQ